MNTRMSSDSKTLLSAKAAPAEPGEPGLSGRPRATRSRLGCTVGLLAPRGAPAAGWRATFLGI